MAVMQALVCSLRENWGLLMWTGRARTQATKPKINGQPYFCFYPHQSENLYWGYCHDTEQNQTSQATKYLTYVHEFDALVHAGRFTHQ